MRATVRWFLVVVLTLNAAAAAVLLFGPFPASWALAEDSDEAPATAPPDRDALRLLGLELAERVAELDRRQEQLEELLRSEEVLARAQSLGGPAPSDAVQDQDGTEAFTRILRAYENMEPESAAKALVELAARNQDAVVELLLGWQPRTSGAILDALIQTDPALAAELSYTVWKTGGNVAAPAASSGP